jgi:hypothetical protein
MSEKVSQDLSPSPPNEKDIGDVARTEHAGGLPDPDAGLSDEERAAIVCFRGVAVKTPSSSPCLQDKKLVRKLDWKLIPWLTLLYLVSFLDSKLL